MEESGFLGNERGAAAVIFAFLQADCRDGVDYGSELLSLGKDLNLPLDINYNGEKTENLLDGDLETDGGLQSNSFLDDIRPQVDLHWHNAPAEVAVLHQVAEELREIAAQLELNIVSRATERLSQNIRASHSEEWTYHLSNEVEKAMRQSVALKDLPQERVMVALTLTMVKGVCEQTPQLLRRLFDTALHFICRGRAR